MRIELSELSTDGHLTATIVNAAGTDVSVWEDTNSWGYGHWRIYVVRDGVISVHYQDPDANFTRNIPAFRRLKPNETVRFKLDLNDGSWIGVATTRNRFISRDRIIVSYDVPVSGEARKMNVWYGVAAAIIDLE